MNIDDASDLYDCFEWMLDKDPVETPHVLAKVCYDKAEHVRTAWQDEELAHHWELVAKQIEQLRFP